MKNDNPPNGEQSKRIQQWQPWAHSTGPKTKAGKERSKMNALKTGRHSKPMKEIEKIIRAQLKWLRNLK